MTKISTHSIFHKHFLNAKTSQLNPKIAVTVLPDEPLENVITIMKENKIGSVLICDASGELKGIFTERDPVLKLLPEPINYFMHPVKNFMSNPVVSVKSETSIARSIYEMVTGGFRHLVVVNKTNNEKMIISARDVVTNLYQKLTKQMLDPDNDVVSDELNVDRFFSSTLDAIPLERVLIVPPNTSMSKAVQTMKSSKVSCVIVAENEKSARGIFTERDFLDKVLTNKQSLANLKVADFQIKSPQTMLPKTSIALAFQHICKGGFRHLPIVNEDEKLIGILTIRSFLKAIAENILSDLSKK